MWPDRRFLELVSIDLPIIQAPMAGANDSAMVVQVCNAGGLGSLPCAMLDADKVRSEILTIRKRTNRPFNLNFFCHTPTETDRDREKAWKQKLAVYYEEFGLDITASVSAVSREPFNEEMCELVEEFRPEVISFHFGLPNTALFSRVRAAGCKILSSATTAEEARYLEEQGCDAIIAQGNEAGGHRGMFLSDNIASQPGTFSLVPQVADAVSVPVIAAGGISDARGIAAAFALGASAVQIGTAYLFTPESLISDLHRSALNADGNDETMLTNVFSGKPARGLVNRVMREVGPMSELAPAFPTAGGALAPLKTQAEAMGSADFSSLWSGQSAKLCNEMGARELTERLGETAVTRLEFLS
jgi:nitronate monooxygenase